MAENGDQPATKKDVTEVREELLRAMERQREDFRTAMETQREELVEAIHDSETRLLKAFYAYAESADKHMKDLDGSDLAKQQRLAALESRLLAVEKRLNIPPAS